jgi:hypothetical protein
MSVTNDVVFIVTYSYDSTGMIPSGSLQREGGVPDLTWSIKEVGGGRERLVKYQNEW